eukprot:scaffold213196_cov22-Tisochrysis_lutea.AAC.2
MDACCQADHRLYRELARRCAECGKVVQGMRSSSQNTLDHLITCLLKASATGVVQRMDCTESSLCKAHEGVEGTGCTGHWLVEFRLLIACYVGHGLHREEIVHGAQGAGWGSTSP